jgi:hypothetical protein
MLQAIPTTAHFDPECLQRVSIFATVFRNLRFTHAR